MLVEVPAEEVQGAAAQRREVGALFSLGSPDPPLLTRSCHQIHWLYHPCNVLPTLCIDCDEW